MMMLAGIHMHQAVGGWPIMVAVGVFVLVIACAAIVLLRRRTSDLPSASIRRTETPDYAEDDYDAKILAMLRQKGEPMSQSEIAENLGWTEKDLAKWLVSMEQREMLRRTWNPEGSTYMVHLPAEG